MTIITNEEKIVNDVADLLKTLKSKLEKIVMECLDLKDNLDISRLMYFGFNAENEDVKRYVLELSEQLIIMKKVEKSC